ncbi:MAG: SMP-30/gluconolactonase/LRE family protein [Pirellulaceae bacterium]
MFHRSITTAVLLTIFFFSAAVQDPALAEPTSDIVPESAKLETLWEEGGFTEGAASGPDGCIYFSDFAQPFESGPARIMKFDPASGKISVHCPDSGMGNGLMFTRDGRLIGCCASPLGGHRALVEFLPSGKVKPLISKFKGNRFNSPNDLVIDSVGRIYFTDPKYVGPEKLELTSFDVYRYDPDKTVRVATAQITKPNGIGLAPDGKTLYVAETDNGSATADLDKTPAKKGRMTLNAFSVNSDGSLGDKKVLHNFQAQTGIDGMTVDVQGHIYTAVRSEDGFGIVVFSKGGNRLAHIPTPELPTNCVFGRGKQSKILYITAGGGLYRIRLTIDGHHPALR